MGIPPHSLTPILDGRPVTRAWATRAQGTLVNLGKLLVTVGLSIALVGLVVLASGRWKWLKFGRLPGDFVYERNGFGLYVPFMSMILISLALTLVLWIAGKIRL